MEVFLKISKKKFTSTQHARKVNTRDRLKDLKKFIVPDPATPTVAAPAPMNLAAESISLETAEV